MLYLTDYRQHLSRVSVQREAMLGPPCNAACFRGVPQRGVAARLASVAGYAGPDENVLLSRSKNLRKYKSVRLTLIIIGIVASVCHDEVFDFGQLLRT